MANGYQEIKWKPRKKVFENSNGKNRWNDQTKTAISYGHWTYARLINGKLVFNDGKYSVTTSGHQYMMREFLENRGIKVDFFIDIGSSSLNETNIVETYTYKIAKLKMNLEHKPRLRKKTKEEMQYCLKELTEFFNTLVKELNLSRMTDNSIKQIEKQYKERIEKGERMRQVYKKAKLVADITKQKVRVGHDEKPQFY